MLGARRERVVVALGGTIHGTLETVLQALQHLWADQDYTGPNLQALAAERGFVVMPDGQFVRVALPATFEPLPKNGSLSVH
jgi:hypothetical protein